VPVVRFDPAENPTAVLFDPDVVEAPVSAEPEAEKEKS